MADRFLPAPIGGSPPNPTPAPMPAPPAPAPAPAPVAPPQVVYQPWPPAPPAPPVVQRDRLAGCLGITLVAVVLIGLVVVAGLSYALIAPRLAAWTPPATAPPAVAPVAPSPAPAPPAVDPPLLTAYRRHRAAQKAAFAALADNVASGAIKDKPGILRALADSSRDFEVALDLACEENSDASGNVSKPAALADLFRQLSRVSP